MRKAYFITIAAILLTGVFSTSTVWSRGKLTSSRETLENLKASHFAGSVTLVNGSWNSVTVEVRKGKFDDVNQNAVFETRKMGKGRWTIPCESSEGYVWWRRDADPDHPNGQWTGWTRKACFGKDEETSL